MPKVECWSDGGCHGVNAINGQIWGSFKIGDNPIEELEFGEGSNNVAEYKTLIACLKRCIEMDVKPTIYIDSQLVYQQCLGNWRVKETRLKPLREEAVRLLNQSGALLEWTPRENIVKVLGH